MRDLSRRPRVQRLSMGTIERRIASHRTAKLGYQQNSQDGLESDLEYLQAIAAIRRHQRGNSSKFITADAGVRQSPKANIASCKHISP